MSSLSGDYYRRLRLSRNASRREIKTAFRRLSRQYHPDLHPNQPAATIKFQALREAYEVLSDRIQRQRYDQIQQGYGDNRPLTNPQSPTDFYIRGVRYLLSQGYRAALADFSRAIELDEQFAEAYLRRAETRYALGDDSGVLVDAQQAVALNSTEASTYYYQGMARYRLGYVQSAIAAFTDAITCDPEEARSYYRRGLAHQDLNEWEAAARDLRRAARLYRAQGNVVSYQRLQAYLRSFGLAGQPQSLKLLSGLLSRFSRTMSPRRGDRTTCPLPNANQPTQAIKGIPPFSVTPEPSRSPVLERPETEVPWHCPGKPLRALNPSRSASFSATNLSSRPAFYDSPRHSPLHFLCGARTILTLLSNPAGEMGPTFHRLSHRQANIVGYGLAILANLSLVLGVTQYLNTDSWLLSSWVWAAGGMTFVAMVLAVALGRVFLRLKGLWVADIFMLGTAMAPLGVLALAIAVGSDLIHPLSQLAWLIPLILLVVMLWAFSQSLLTLYNGLCHIHSQPFPTRVATWFAPMVLGLGIAAGVGTFGFLAIGL